MVGIYNMDQAADEVRRQYFDEINKFAKERKRDVFRRIAMALFKEYGLSLGFYSFSAFLSAVSKRIKQK